MLPFNFPHPQQTVNIALTVINNGNGASVANGLTAFAFGLGNASCTTYIYYAPDNTWYRYS